MRVLLGLIAWTLAEIALFVTIGSWIGVLGTLLVVLGSGMAGMGLLRWQGLRAIQSLKSNLVVMPSPLTPMAHSGLIGLAAVLLILPGFLSDVMGILLLLPQTRRGIIGYFGTMLRMRVVDRAVRGIRPDHDEVVDAEAIEVTQDEPLGWTKP